MVVSFTDYQLLCKAKDDLSECLCECQFVSLYLIYLYCANLNMGFVCADLCSMVRAALGHIAVAPRFADLSVLLQVSGHLLMTNYCQPPLVESIIIKIWLCSKADASADDDAAASEDEEADN